MDGLQRPPVYLGGRIWADGRVHNRGIAPDFGPRRTAMIAICLENRADDFAVGDRDWPAALVRDLVIGPQA
jgi:hypothetical protein